MMGVVVKREGDGMHFVHRNNHRIKRIGSIIMRDLLHHRHHHLLLLHRIMMIMKDTIIITDVAIGNIDVTKDTSKQQMDGSV